MSDEFFVEYRVKWDDIDPNFHLRAAVLVDYAVNTQFAWLEHLGFAQSHFAEQGYEPIVSRMEARYHKEAGHNEVVRDTPTVVAASPDFSAWKIRHSYSKNGGKDRVGWILLEGTWLSWKTRTAVAPSAAVLQALNRMPRSDNFEELRSVVRAKTGAP